MALFPLVYFFMLGGGQSRPSPAPVAQALYLKFVVRDDATGTEVLNQLDRMGEVKRMMNFDGSNLEAIWVPDDAGTFHGSPVSDQVLLDLDDMPGVQLLTARVAKPVGTTG